MDRKKPSLTSPWKVGFLVALLLVVTSLGVSYVITGTFGVTWHWLQIGGLSPSTWTFNLGAFFEEMAPLLVLTSLLAFGAYVLVAGAVRRYKPYVDSGVEYKQLLKSIKTIEDLEDETLHDRLKQHPELREFLMGLKHRVSMEKNGERDRKPVPAAPSAERDGRSRLQSESALLASAIANGRDAFSRELALTVPELKQIERAIRELLSNSPDPVPAVSPVPPAPADTAELDAVRSSVRATAKSLRRDVDACKTGASELEAALAALGTALQKSATAAPSGDTAAVQKRVDATAAALAELGEESRRIAIAAAMQASGGPEADAIKVAEELRTLATRFNATAQAWRETTPALKAILGGAAQNRSTDEATSAASAAISRARLWGERTIAMNEHVRALERAVQAESDPAELAPAIPMPPAQSVSTLDLADEAVPAQESAPGADTSEDLVARNNAEMFGSDDDGVATFADIPGFEQEHRFFAEPSDNGAEKNEDRFVVDRADDGRWDLSSSADAPADEESAPAPTTAQTTTDPDGFLTGPRPVVSPQKIERPAPKMAPRTPAPEPVSESSTATATLDPDADAIDLYELGAIDCVQTA